MLEKGYTEAVGSEVIKALCFHISEPYEIFGVCSINHVSEPFIHTTDTKNVKKEQRKCNQVIVLCSKYMFELIMFVVLN